MLARIDPLLATPGNLTNADVSWLVDFLRVGLQDPKANAHDLRKLLPARLPSGRPVANFQ